MPYRTESDSLGKIEVPQDAYWGAQTQRSLQNFQIGNQKMPLEIIHALALLKKAAAQANAELDVLSAEKASIIGKVCEEIQQGERDKDFPLVVWQTGSGTQTNMNVNEVIANRAHVLQGGKLTDATKFLHPNDDVNKSQSSNDVFPSAVYISLYTKIIQKTLPVLSHLQKVLTQKAEAFADIVKIGRTHCMDATPLTLGQEFSGYAAQLQYGIDFLKTTTEHLTELALGGTAVGTGLNAPKGFAKKAIQYLNAETGFSFTPAKNTFAALAAHDQIVAVHGAMKTVAVALFKIANDIRLLGSGPRAGLGELLLPANEPGSSIMPGKVNPTQCEAFTMVCAQVMGNDTTITIAGASGQFELNVFKPLMGYTALMSAQFLADAAQSFAENCVVGIEANKQKIQQNLENSLMLVTALTPHIGYDKAAEIAKKAHAEGTTLRAAALELGFVSAEEFDEWVDPRKMTN